MSYSTTLTPPLGTDPRSAQFGRMCRALGMNHRIAPTPQAKGKIERAMRTFQHRIVVVLKAEGVDNEARARTLRKTVWLAIRPENAGFYVLETRPDPTNPVVPRILAKYRF